MVDGHEKLTVVLYAKDLWVCWRYRHDHSCGLSSYNRKRKKHRNIKHKEYGYCRHIQTITDNNLDCLWELLKNPCFNRSFVSRHCISITKNSSSLDCPRLGTRSWKFDCTMQYQEKRTSTKKKRPAQAFAEQTAKRRLRLLSTMIAVLNAHVVAHTPLHGHGKCTALGKLTVLSRFRGLRFWLGGLGR